MHYPAVSTPTWRRPSRKSGQALSRRSDWSNFEAHPDTTRVSSIEDFYRARFLYRLSLGGEAVEAGLAALARTLARWSELQTVALEGILTQLNALLALAGETAPDPARGTRPCATWCAYSTAWPTTPKPSWPASPVQSTCSSGRAGRDPIQAAPDRLPESFRQRSGRPPRHNRKPPARTGPQHRTAAPARRPVRTTIAPRWRAMRMQHARW